MLGALAAPASAHAQTAPEIHATRPLTGPAPVADRVARARAFARAHAGALGLTAARVDALAAPERRSAPDGLVQLRWGRSYGGIPAVDDALRITLGANGAVLAAAGTAAGTAPASLTPTLGPVEAMAAVREDAGAAGTPIVASGPSGPRRDTRFAGGGRARLAVYGSRLAWQVDYAPSPTADYDTLVDAATGAILHRANQVKLDAAPANVWDYFPGASPVHQVDLHAYGLDSDHLENPWMHVFSDVNGNERADAGEEVGPGFAFTLDTSFTGTGCAAATPCTWAPPADFAGNREADAVEAFYLANVYRRHLAAPPFGFDAFDSAARDDKLLVQTDYDAANGEFDNSSMDTVPPGAVSEFTGLPNSRMRLLLFGVRDGARAVDGGDDASILFHEYTHGFTNRTVVYGDGYQALNDPQAFALDEASADFFALSFLADEGQARDTAVPGEVDLGTYTDAEAHLIRAEAIDCPVGAPVQACPRGGVTYADFGHIAGLDEPHANGEIWAETMWDVRTHFGSALATRLAADALHLVAPEPTFLDMRDAILEADANVAAQEHRAGDAQWLWKIFATRGMGYDATTTSGPSDDTPKAGFAMPPGIADPTAAPTPPPAVTPAPTATPVAAPRQPSFALKASGRRALAFTVTCHALCNVIGTLSVDSKTAKKLKLGKRRIVGRLTARLTGTRSFTVRLNRAAAKALERVRKVRSFRATLTVQAGYPGAVIAFKHRTVTVRR